MSAAFSAKNILREAGADGACPPEIAACVEANLARLEQRVADDATWASATVAKDRDGILVRYVADPVTGERWYRTDCTYGGVSAEQVFQALKYENRQWDPVVATPAYLRSYELAGRHADVVCFTSKPQAGGIISARAFAGVRHTRRTQHEGTVRIVLSVCDAPAEYARTWFDMTDAEKCVRASSFPGGAPTPLPRRKSPH